MNLVVCVKQVADTTVPISINHQTKTIETAGMVYVANPCDKVATEEAVRIKEALGSGKVTLVSMGSTTARDALRDCLALGADGALLLCDPAFEGSDPYATALVLARSIGTMEYDLILCGKEADDDAAGQVGALLAEMLHIPYLAGATKLSVSAPDKKVVLHQRLEKGDRRVVACPLPAVVAVEPDLNQPRYPSLPALMAARRKRMEERDAAALGLLPEAVGAKGARTRILSFSPPKPRLKKLFIPDSSLPAQQRLRLILSGGVAEKKGELLRGDARKLASQVFQFLRQEKIVS
ncbi:MAG: electron transfer flavoprotein subunit beta/FixA family protein [Chloroflexi bacterium]|nr:electron transfer flavoprotein subunit beta/FixA family protein [Chloroflexota bacterium]